LESSNSGAADGQSAYRYRAHCHGAERESTQRQGAERPHRVVPRMKLRRTRRAECRREWSAGPTLLNRIMMMLFHRTARALGLATGYSIMIDITRFDIT
jgi:hypothetical protein